MSPATPTSIGARPFEEGERQLKPVEPLDIVEGDGIRAGYKIEITFGPNRSSTRDYTALISLWESGKFFHGGGDASMYFCLDCRILHPKTAVKLIEAILNGEESR